MSSDSVQAAFAVFNQAVASQQTELQSREATVQQREEQLEAEKKRMAQIDAKDTDVIQLNVGGRPFATTRKTLCLEPDTMLATMFSGRWEDRVPRDDKGRVFLNFNPDLFAILLDYLRAKELAPPGKTIALPPASQMPPTQQSAYEVMLHYLGFGDAQTGGTEKFAFAATGVGIVSDNFTVTEDGKKAAYTATNGVRGALMTEQKCEPGVSVWRVKPTGQLFLGVVRDTFSGTPSCMFQSEGYLFQCDNFYCFANGQAHALPTGAAFTQVNHTVALSLSTDGVLTLKNETTGTVHTIPGVNMTETYRFVFHPYAGATSVEILDV